MWCSTSQTAKRTSNNGMIFPLKPYLRTIFRTSSQLWKSQTSPISWPLKWLQIYGSGASCRGGCKKGTPTVGFHGVHGFKYVFFSGGNRPLKGVLLTPSATASGFGSECVAKSPCGKQKQLKNDITQITNGKREPCLSLIYIVRCGRNQWRRWKLRSNSLLDRKKNKLY